MKVIKEIAAAASRLWGRLLKKRSFFAPHSAGRRAAYRRLWLLGSFVFVFVLMILLPTLAVNSAQVELLALKKSVDTVGPCHEACRQERLIRRQKIAASLLEDKQLLSTVASYFQINNPEHAKIPLDFYQELLAIINLAYKNQEPPAFLVDYLAAIDGREEVKALMIRLILSRFHDPELVDYYFFILESPVGLMLKEESIRSLNAVPASSDFLEVEQIDRLVSLILSADFPDVLKPSLVFLLAKYESVLAEAVVAGADKIYFESSEPVVKLLVADLMVSWGKTDYPYPEVSEDEWNRYFK